MLTTAQLLLGSQWSQCFPDSAAVSASTVIPRQMVCFLHQALDRLKITYEQLEESRVTAAASYAVLTDTHKRRRAQGA